MSAVATMALSTDPAVVRAVHDLLGDAGFTEAGLGTDLGAGDRRFDGPHVLDLLTPGDDSRLACLTRLLLAGTVVDEHAGEAALGAELTGALQAAGVLQRTAGTLAPTVRLVPDCGALLASDIQPSTDYVPGIQPPSRLLAALTSRLPVGSALDLGCGCGIQTILAARHSERVVAVDVNPRALEVTAFNALLDGAANVETREGEWLAPVQGERFELVVCNPPFLISPAADYVFRDSDRDGDDLCRELVEGTPALLAEDGVAFVVCSWTQTADTSWDARPRAWLHNSGCDAILLRYETEDVATYARSWNQGIADETRLDAEVAHWLRYYASRGIEAITSGVVILRRRTGENWVQPVEATSRVSGTDASSQILQMFAAADLLDGLADERALLDLSCELVDGHRLDQGMDYRDGSYHVPNPVLSFADGLGHRSAIDPLTTQVLFRLGRGDRELRGVIADAALESAIAVGEIETVALADLRRLVALGFVTAREL